MKYEMEVQYLFVMWKTDEVVQWYQYSVQMRNRPCCLTKNGMSVDIQICSTSSLQQHKQQQQQLQLLKKTVTADILLSSIKSFKFNLTQASTLHMLCLSPLLTRIA